MENPFFSDTEFNFSDSVGNLFPMFTGRILETLDLTVDLPYKTKKPVIIVTAVRALSRPFCNKFGKRIQIYHRMVAN